MHYCLLVYFSGMPLHVSSMLAAHHQEDQLCINITMDGKKHKKQYLYYPPIVMISL